MTRPTRTGFTIVELLIVIVVIGILATITLIAYNGTQDKAKNVTVESDLQSLSEKIGIFQADTTNNPSGLYPQSHNDLVGLALHLSPAGQTVIYCYDPTNNDYSLIGRELDTSNAAGYIWKADGTKTASETAYDTTLGGPAAICSNLNANYTVSDIGSNFGAP